MFPMVNLPFASAVAHCSHSTKSTVAKSTGLLSFLFRMVPEKEYFWAKLRRQINNPAAMAINLRIGKYFSLRYLLTFNNHNILP